MQKIEATDDKMKKIDTEVKLINKYQIIMYNAGPQNIIHTIKENDENYFFHSHEKNSQIATLETLNSLISSWAKPINYPNTIKKHSKLKSLFWSDKQETENYFKRSYSHSEEVQDLNYEEEQEEKE